MRVFIEFLRLKTLETGKAIAIAAQAVSIAVVMAAMLWLSGLILAAMLWLSGLILAGYLRWIWPSALDFLMRDAMGGGNVWGEVPIATLCATCLIAGAMYAIYRATCTTVRWVRDNWEQAKYNVNRRSSNEVN
ncbi:MAG: hypothetical protein GF334_04305 [Candidatus Altiarchaeales archaeon]|nr:hypothetical protein [Candidatus Altiarchaeales archaeon]